MSKKKKVTATSNSTTIQVDLRNEISNPEKVTGETDGQVLFIVENLDIVPHTVSIPTDKVKNKGSGKLENPFKKNTLEPATVKAGRTGFITGELKSKFNKPVEKFKYTIESDGTYLDPDLDVVEPPLEPGPKRKSPTSRR